MGEGEFNVEAKQNFVCWSCSTTTKAYRYFTKHKPTCPQCRSEMVCIGQFRLGKKRKNGKRRKRK